MRGGVRFEWGVGEVLVCVGCVVLCSGDGWVGLFIYFHDYLPIIVTQYIPITKKKQNNIYISSVSSPVNRSIA